MKFTSQGIAVESNFTPTKDQLLDIAFNENCARSFMGKKLEEVIKPTTHFYSIHRVVGGEWLGAFLIEPMKYNTVCHHILLFSPDRETALVATQLAAFMARITGYIPYTTVSTAATYDYMRKFLADCGFVLHDTKDTYDVITIPVNYIPNLPVVVIGK